ncbi:hypothetical protein F5Y04DRAFT_266082, partial [Hypomontagnella monticulosa]
MASNQPAPAAASPLSMMKKLSPFVFFYEPETVATRQVRSPPAPKLILIAAWMDARELHISKYVTQYQAIYPTSRIVLVKFVFKESVYASFTRKVVEPVVAYLRSQIESGDLSASPTQPEILVHLFSNGGSATMREIYQSFRSTGRPFPLHTAVYDSCPGVYSFSNIYNVFMVNFSGSLLRLVAAPFITVFVTCLWIWYNPLRFLSGEDFLTKNSRVHNDLDLVKQSNRSYVYGKADDMVDWRHVEKHAFEAEKKGLAVRREVFENSPHVAHMRMDSERYWKIVTETWDKAI